MSKPLPRVVVLGAGPAGLTAAYVLSKQGIPVEVLESDPVYVGGIARTVRYKGFHFDVGGHRFFSKSKEVEDFWTEILGADMLQRPRCSRIFYNGKLFAYPLKASDALTKLGVVESARCVLSYLRAQVRPRADERSFEDWVCNRFGRRLFHIFFKTYTEKVWGMSCKEISADWAAQRIQGLSLATAIRNALFPQRVPKNRGAVVKTLIDTFRYPRRGPGMMWEACADAVRRMGGRIYMGRRASGCNYDSEKNEWTVTATAAEGAEESFRGEHVVSSIPIGELGGFLQPRLPPPSLEASRALRYRDFLTVGLILKDRRLFPDNWIYIHDPGVKVGRIQNYKAWSPEMVPDPAFCCYGLEYFCFEGDGLWTMPDDSLVALAASELEKIGLAAAADIVDGCVIRQPKAYPVYDDNYAAHVDTVRRTLESAYPNLHLVGRNGMHKYNNQDHAMMTAMLTAGNIIAGRRIRDPWLVNQDAEYHEASQGAAKPGSALRHVPGRVRD